MLNEYSATITTDASGDNTTYVESTLLTTKIHGRVVALKYAPGTIDTGGDLTITGETTGVAVLTVTNAGTSTVWYYPVAPANIAGNAAASSLTEVPIHLYNERMKVVTAQGGATKTGTITLYVDEG